MRYYAQLKTLGYIVETLEGKRTNLIRTARFGQHLLIDNAPAFESAHAIYDWGHQSALQHRLNFATWIISYVWNIADTSDYFVTCLANTLVIRLQDSFSMTTNELSSELSIACSITGRQFFMGREYDFSEKFSNSTRQFAY